jgi:hypothetical protein
MSSRKTPPQLTYAHRLLKKESVLAPVKVVHKPSIATSPRKIGLSAVSPRLKAASAQAAAAGARAAVAAACAAVAEARAAVAQASATPSPPPLPCHTADDVNNLIHEVMESTLQPSKEKATRLYKLIENGIESALPFTRATVAPNTFDDLFFRKRVIESVLCCGLRLPNSFILPKFKPHEYGVIKEWMDTKLSKDYGYKTRERPTGTELLSHFTGQNKCIQDFTDPIMRTLAQGYAFDDDIVKKLSSLSDRISLLPDNELDTKFRFVREFLHTNFFHQEKHVQTLTAIASQYVPPYVSHKFAGLVLSARLLLALLNNEFMLIKQVGKDAHTLIVGTQT